MVCPCLRKGSFIGWCAPVYTWQGSLNCVVWCVPSLLEMSNLISIVWCIHVCLRWNNLTWVMWSAAVYMRWYSKAWVVWCAPVYKWWASLTLGVVVRPSLYQSSQSNMGGVSCLYESSWFNMSGVPLSIWKFDLGLCEGAVTWKRPTMPVSSTYTPSKGYQFNVSTRRQVCKVVRCHGHRRPPYITHFVNNLLVKKTGAATS